MFEKNKFWMLLLALLFFFGVTSCQADKKTDSEYRILVDDFATITLVQDHDSFLYDSAIVSVGEYLENPSDQNLKSAQKMVDETIKEMEEGLSSAVSYEMTDSLRELLTDHDIDPEEYRINADMRRGYLIEYVGDLENLKFYLDMMETGDLLKENLEFTYDYQMREQKILRDFYYSGINYWFAQWDQDSLQYVEEQVLSKLQSFGTEDSVWETSREAVNRRLNLYLDQMEGMMEEWTAFIGEQQEKLYEETGQKNGENK